MNEIERLTRERDEAEALAQSLQYCDEHRHLAGAVIKPKEAVPSKEQSHHPGCAIHDEDVCNCMHPRVIVTRSSHGDCVSFTDYLLLEAEIERHTAQIEYLSKGRKLDKEEIERLTAYIKQWAEDDAERDAQFQELERVLESLQNKWASRPIDHPNGEALGKENESLRAALERIASAGEIHDPHWAGKVAREALAPQTEPKRE